MMKIRRTVLLFFLFNFSSSIYGIASDKNTLNLAWENIPRSFDPRYGVDADSQYLENLLHCSLIDFDPNGAPIGYLADSWTWETNTVLALKIKKDAKFGDGHLVTLDDVKATLDFFLRKDLKIPTPRANAFSLVETIEIKNDSLIIKLKEPDSTFLVNNLVIGILPKQAVTDEVINEQSHIKGCGPFILEKADLNQITLTRNPHFSLGNAPKASEVNIKIVKDESTRFAKLQKGEVDIVQNSISYEKLAGLSQNYPNLKIVKKAGLKTAYIGFNFNDPILKNRDVRLALAKAINKQAIITHILKGLATEAATLLPPNSPYYAEKMDKISYDPESAKQILDKAGFIPKKDTTRLQLSYKTTHDTLRIAIAKAVASDLRKIGVELKIETLEWGRFKDDVEKGRVQLWGLTWIGFKDPDIYRYAFASESFPPNGGNRGRFSNPEIDLLVEQARKETNESNRKQLYSKVQEIISRELPYIFLWHEDIYAVVNKEIQQFEIYADGRYGSLKNVYKN